jgi:O-antigen biosynthesis protein WbqV
VDLAAKMIRLHGLRPDIDIQIQEVGLRPGEKLHESLTTSDEDLMPTTHPRVRRVRGASGRVPHADELLRAINELTAIAEQGDNAAVAAALFRLVGEPSGGPGLVPRNGRVMTAAVAAQPTLAAGSIRPDSAA